MKEGGKREWKHEGMKRNMVGGPEGSGFAQKWGRIETV